MGDLSAFALFYLGATAVGAVVAFGLAVVAWRRRDQPAAPQFALLNLDVAGWCATAVLIRLGVPGATFIWHVNNVFVFALIFVWFAFVLAYTGRSGWLRRWPMLALWSLPTAVAVSSFVPPARQLLVVHQSPTVVEGLTVIPSSFTTLGAILLVFVFLVDLAAFGLLGLFFVRSRSPYRKQIGAISGARLFGLGTAIAFYAGLFSHSDLNLVPAVYAVQSLVIAWALFRYDLLDVVPLTADTIVDQMADGVVVLDADDCIVDYNPALTELVGDDEVMDRPASEVLPGLLGALEADGVVRVSPDSLDTDGPRTRIYDPQTTPLYDHHDIYRGRLVVLRDVTLQQTRERTLEALQSSTEQFLDASDPESVADIAVETAQLALACPYSGIILYDETENLLRPAALADELAVALREAGMLHRDDDGRLYGVADRDGKIEEVFTTGEPIVDESLEFESEDGHFSITSVLLLPLGEHGVFGIGKTTGDATLSADDRRFARTLADSTETALDRIKREAELEESRRAVEQRTEQLQFFNSALRHDLRNAITVIDGNLRFLSEHVTEAGRPHFETVSKWVDDVSDLVDTVASITDAVTDDDDRDLSAVPLSDVLEDRVRKVADGHENLTVETTIPDGLTVTGDELVGEVVENLLLNAVEHNDSDEPQIDVTAETVADAVRVRIADNGPGIPDQFRGDVFDPGVTSEDSGSLGFGLYFVKVMMERYGGDVHFEANDPRGTVAVLTFPTPSDEPDGSQSDADSGRDLA